MSTLLQKAMLLGLGIASISQQKIDKYIDHLKKKNNLSEKEGRRLARDLIRKSKELQKEFAKVAVKNINSFLKNNRHIKKKDIEALRKIVSGKKMKAKARNKKKR